MAINVYWACVEDQWMLAEEPQTVSSVFYSKNLIDDNRGSKLNYCPSFNKNLKNLYALKSIYEYAFKVTDQGLATNMYDQKFFEDHVVVRSMDKQFFSYQTKYIFFTDAPSLNVTFYEYPFLENNNITTRCIPVAGQFDIGKWFRNTEFAFYLKPEYDEFKIEREEIYSYMRFHTEEKINFVQFRFNDKLNSYVGDGFALTFGHFLKNLEDFYKLFKNKKAILKEIRNNLV